jgi:hypothetical protein
VRIIDAVWEQRNLGVSCVEVAIETNDTVADVKDRLPQLSAQYLVIKVPAGRSDVMFQLSEMGYAFIEASIRVSKQVAHLGLSGIQQRLADSVGHALMEENDFQELRGEIRNGMFDTDRICLDPRFTKDQAARRYIGWIEDEVTRGSQVYKLLYKGQSIGFFTMKDLGAGVYYPFLAGMYANYRHSGLGFTITYKPLCEIAARGGKLLSTYISTNNDKAVRIHASLGFSFDHTAYVYVKHNDTSVNNRKQSRASPAQ